MNEPAKLKSHLRPIYTSDLLPICHPTLWLALMCDTAYLVHRWAVCAEMGNDYASANEWARYWRREPINITVMAPGLAHPVSKDCRYSCVGHFRHIPAGCRSCKHIANSDRESMPVKLSMNSCSINRACKQIVSLQWDRIVAYLMFWVCE